MGEPLILLCRYFDETYMVPVEYGDSFRTFMCSVCGRFPGLRLDNVSMHYSLPGHGRCVLGSDSDFRCMISLAVSYTMKRIEVDVCKKDVQSGSSNAIALVSYTGGSAQFDDEVDLLPSFCPHKEKVLMSVGWENCVSHVGKKFEGGAKEFRICLRKLSLKSGFQFNYIRNHSNRIKAVCAQSGVSGCDWMVMAAREPVNGFFYIKKFNNGHTCGTGVCNFKGKRVSSDLVGSLIEDKLRVNALTRPIDVLHQMRSEYGINISYDHARLGVVKAKSVVYGDMKESFQLLRWYVGSILETNPGSYVALDIDESSKCFVRLFVAFHACVQGFHYCRPTLCLDGSHLKTEFKGHIFSATGKDGDQGLFPLCFAIVDSENTVNWKWFLEHLKNIVNPDVRITFISDRNSGILESVPQVFPDAFHAFCLNHLKNNMKDKCAKYSRGKGFRDRMVYLLRECAYAPTVDMYNSKMKELMNEGKHVAEDFFSNLKPENWANAHFKGCRYGDMCSNAAESFNSWIVPERHLPVMNMVEMIRSRLMKQMADRRVACKKWNSYLCPEIDSRLAELYDFSRSWKLVKSSEYVYQVECDPVVKVDLQYATCTCRGWQINQLPCTHVMACIMSSGLQLSNFVPACFSVSMFAQSYQFEIAPLPTVSKPLVVEERDVVLPPVSKRPPGRPKKKRIPSRGEEAPKKKRKCGRCHLIGNHNKRSCKEPIQL